MIIIYNHKTIFFQNNNNKKVKLKVKIFYNFKLLKVRLLEVIANSLLQINLMIKILLKIQF